MEYGDSIEKVRANIPSSLEPIRSDKLRSNGIAALMIAPVMVADRDFKANFYFNEEGLYRVLLIADAIFSEDEADATERVIIEALVKKYGYSSKTADLNKTVLEDEPLWMLWNFQKIEIMLVPQHHNEKIMISYQLSDLEKRQRSERAAEQYMKKADVDKTAESL